MQLHSASYLHKNLNRLIHRRAGLDPGQCRRRQRGFGYVAKRCAKFSPVFMWNSRLTHAAPTVNHKPKIPVQVCQMKLKVSMRFLDHLWPFLMAPIMVITIAASMKQQVEAHDMALELDPQAIYTAAWAQIKQLYVDPDFAGQDWATWEHKFDGQLHSQSDAVQAVKVMVASLHDPYTRIAEPQVQAVQATQTTVAAVATTSQQPVTAKLLEGNVGYIKVTTFQSVDCPRNVRAALDQFANADGIIFDLRGNRGGLVTNALEIADMLLEEGSIVTVISREHTQKYGSSYSPITHQKLVVLVDQNSASATEILTGALKDNHRATIIGTKTFGKGLVQQVNVLPGGAVLYVTTAHYLTPSGADINKVGIVPNVEVTDEAEEMKAAMQQLHV